MSNKEIPRHLSAHREAPNRHEKGGRKYRDWVHSESKKADSKNLPFKFSKPKKSKPYNTLVWCEHCGNKSTVTEVTVAVICSKCGKLYKVSEGNKEECLSDNLNIVIKAGGGDEEKPKRRN